MNRTEHQKETGAAYYRAHREQMLAKGALYYREHKEEKSAYDVAYRAAHRAKKAAYDSDYAKRNRTHLNLLGRCRAYGISAQDFRGLLEAQGGKCAICRLEEATCIDHDHTTGMIRGLLCQRCNLQLGTLEKTEWVAMARAYLGKDKGT